MKRVPALLLFATLLAVAFLPLHILAITDVRQGKTVFTQRISQGETFSLSFVHSVEKSPVTDYFRIDDAYRMVLHETAFRSLNTGLPSTISEGQTLTRTNQGFRLSIPDRVIPDIQLWVDGQYAGTLEVGGKGVSLAGLAGNTLLQVKVKKVFLWEYAFRSLY